jgi:K+-sensing histidine kinase KdpD
LDSTSTDGLGLGLFVVRRAVDLLGHSIEVRSTLGCGSCFSILAKAADTAMLPTRPAYQAVPSFSCGVGDRPPL